MAVALRGYTQGTYDSDGDQTVAWPSGTSAGDLAIVLCATGKNKKPKTRLPSGWTQKRSKSDGTSVWVKKLTASDIASSLAVTARVVLLQTFYGAGSVGKIGAGESVKVTQDGGAMLLCGWRTTDDTLTVSNKVHATDVENESWVTKGKTRAYNTWLRTMATAGTAYIDTNASAFFAVELIPQLVPYAPTPLTPGDGDYLDTTTTTTLSLQHNSANGDTPTFTRIRARAVGSATWYYLKWDATTPTWETTETLGSWPTSTSTTVTAELPAAAWLDDAAGVEWQAATTELTSGGWGTYSESSTFFRIAPPSLVASVTGSGLVWSVAWTPTITNGSQTWYRVRVALAADGSPDNPLHDSGVTSGTDTTYDVPADSGWTNGAAYVAWVEIGQTGGQQSAETASASFTPSWTAPAAPSSLVVNSAARPATITANGLTGRERLRITFTAGDLTHEITVGITEASLTLDLPLAPYGTTTTYSATASATTSGVELWSDPIEALATVYDPSTYLVSTDGLDWIATELSSASEPVDSESALVSYGLGADRPTVVYTTSQGRSGTEVLHAETQTAKDALMAWLSANPSLILRYPPERDGSTYIDNPAIRMARTSPLSESRLVQQNLQMRTLPFSWVEQ